MLVCAYVDWNADTEEEYRDIKEFLQIELGWEFVFKTEMRPVDMLQQSADVYVLDYGGIQAGYGDGGYSFFEREVIKLVEERPNLLILLWTAFTGFGYWTVVREEHPDLANAANVIFCDGRRRFGRESRYDKEWQERAKAWAGGTPVKLTTKQQVLDALPSSLIGITCPEMANLFPHLNRRTIQRHLCALEKAGLAEQMVVGSYSKRDQPRS